MVTCSIWQQPSLVPTPQLVLSSFPCYTKKLYGTSSKNEEKNSREKTHSASNFETLEGFETELFF